MVKCPECGKTNSSQDSYCESCGYRLKPWYTRWWAILLFIFGFLLIYSAFENDGSNSKELLCKPPLLEYKGGECCTDTNSNQICDVYEKEKSVVLKTDSNPTKSKVESETYIKLSDKECIDELTAITILINVLIEQGSNTIYDFNDGIITVSKFRSELIKVSQKFDELKSIIKSKGLDVGCSTEIKNKVVYPLISVNENYALGFKKVSAFSNKEDLQSGLYDVTKADNEKAKIEAYLLSHQG